MYCLGWLFGRTKYCIFLPDSGANHLASNEVPARSVTDEYELEFSGFRSDWHDIFLIFKWSFS